jgi:hypothetical protein
MERYTWDIVSFGRRLQMKDNEPFYFHKDTGFIEGVRIEEYFDPAWLYNIDPAIGYFESSLNAK